jgi:hypothetical protein
MSDLPVLHLTFPEAVLFRPKMYTIGGSYLEVIAFLKGYYGGLSKNDPHLEAVKDWITFQSWLSKRMNVEMGDAFRHLSDIHPNDLEAIQELKSHLEQFVKEKEPHF